MWNLNQSRFKIVSSSLRVFNGANGVTFVDVTLDVRTIAAPETIQLWLTVPQDLNDPPGPQQEPVPIVADRVSGSRVFVSARFQVAPGPYFAVVGNGIDGDATAITV